MLHGIQWLMQHELVVDTHCIRMKQELTQYRWRRDARGDALPIPEAGDDHLMDALRYALEGDRLAAYAAAQRR